MGQRPLLDRHGLVGVLAVHLLLHWKWIVCVLRGKPHSDVSGRRFALGIAGLVAIALLAAAPLMTPAMTAPRSQLLGTHHGAQPTAGNDAPSDEASSETKALRGFMTLAEVAERAGVPAAEILKRLNLPPNTAPSEQVGRLLRLHGLNMSALRQAVAEDDSGE
jgi:hypothetical protein